MIGDNLAMWVEQETLDTVFSFIDEWKLIYVFTEMEPFNTILMRKV